MTKHSPFPWHIGTSYYGGENRAIYSGKHLITVVGAQDYGIKAIGAEKQSAADAAHIVHAANLHDILVETIRVAKNNISSLMNSYPDSYPRHAFQSTYEILQGVIDLIDLKPEEV